MLANNFTLRASAAGSVLGSGRRGSRQRRAETVYRAVEIGSIATCITSSFVWRLLSGAQPIDPIRAPIEWIHSPCGT